MDTFAYRGYLVTRNILNPRASYIITKGGYYIACGETEDIARATIDLLVN